MCIKKNILATLTYFNMFEYPLKKREIYAFLASSTHPHEFDQALAELAEESSIYKIGNFYSLFNNYTLADRRRKGNEKATQLLAKAGKSARLIARFPFIQGVAVSGSLSKQFAGDDADIDFFIITEANRLWIARTLLHLFKKITFLFNTQDYYCMNYFIDEYDFCIREKNIYTATEVVTLIPLHGSKIFEHFYKANAWTKKFLPNKYLHASYTKDVGKTLLRYLLEKLLNNKAGNRLDDFLLKLTSKSWATKTRKKKKDNKGHIMSMHTGKHFSKPDPTSFQQKILERYDTSLSEVFEAYEKYATIKNRYL